MLSETVHNQQDESETIPQLDGNFTVNSDISDLVHQIPVIINQFTRKHNFIARTPHRVTIRRSNRILEATNLPTMLLLNPRSIYNKADEFRTMIEQLEVDICFISESWDRESLPLEEVINMEGYKILKNVVQRRKKGGKPALVIKEEKFHVKHLCPDVVTVPIGVEAVWALVTPKNIPSNSKVKNIAVASIYYTKATKRSDFIDHISEAFAILSAKYGPNLHFAICGDFNRMNIKPILNLAPNLKQLITVPTRKNPDAILENIISTLEYFYLPPFTISPLENDQDKNGKPSDHLPVVFKPVHSLENTKMKYRIIKFRPLPQSGIDNFGEWIKNQSWSEIYEQKNAHLKAEKLQSMLLTQLNISLPEKTLKVNDNDFPWTNDQIKKTDRRRKREYIKKKKSQKWKKLEEQFNEKMSEAKESYYCNIVEDLKTSDIGKWYSKLKRMSSNDPSKSEVNVISLINDPPSIQAEKIADNFARVSQEYEPLQKEDIDINLAKNMKPVPWITREKIHKTIRRMKSKTSTVIDDIPWRLIKEFSVYLSFPLEDIYNRSIIHGEYANIWKLEIVTPAPKSYPPANEDELRKISCSKNCSKIFENILAEFLVADMKPTSDPSQFGNEKGISVQHCLIRMLDTIHTQLDINNQKEAYATIISLIDWSKAFDRQCPRLGVQSFINNGVRRGLIPLLINFFQNRKMSVKWKGILSSIRNLPGGGPQGSTTGLLEYKSQTNNNCTFVPAHLRYKWVDDLSILEMINLINIGLSSYNFHQHVAADIGVDQKYLPSQNILTQSHVDNILQWTGENRMQLNGKKTKIMIINFTKNYQFSTRIHLGDDLLEIIDETRLLGLEITSDLKFHKNTEVMIKKAYARMCILHKLYSFNVPVEDLLHIYILYIRSLVEQNVAVWNHTITQEEVDDIERVQKTALKIILKENYVDYHSALQSADMEKLCVRRTTLCLRFAKSCLKNEKMADMFPLNPNYDEKLRNSEKYQVKFAHNNRLKDSAIPALQRMLNDDAK